MRTSMALRCPCPTYPTMPHMSVRLRREFDPSPSKITDGERPVNASRSGRFHRTGHGKSTIQAERAARGSSDERANSGMIECPHWPLYTVQVIHHFPLRVDFPSENTMPD